MLKSSCYFGYLIHPWSRLGTLKQNSKVCEGYLFIFHTFIPKKIRLNSSGNRWNRSFQWRLLAESHENEFRNDKQIFMVYLNIALGESGRTNLIGWKLRSSIFQVNQWWMIWQLARFQKFHKNICESWVVILCVWAKFILKRNLEHENAKLCSLIRSEQSWP